MQAASQPSAQHRKGDDLAALRAEVRALHAILPGLGASATCRTDTQKGG
ncbi:hypothetical protein [Rhodobaculum claviforme]|nr:hypothetical protein [Rhodobaculum claviforme]